MDLSLPLSISWIGPSEAFRDASPATTGLPRHGVCTVRSPFSPSLSSGNYTQPLSVFPGPEREQIGRPLCVFWMCRLFLSALVGSTGRGNCCILAFIFALSFVPFIWSKSCRISTMLLIQVNWFSNTSWRIISKGCLTFEASWLTLGFLFYFQHLHSWSRERLMKSPRAPVLTMSTSLLTILTCFVDPLSP